MPLLFSLVTTNLEEGEKLFAYLDHLYVVCAPERVGDVHHLLKRHLWRHSRTSIHAGKTKVGNRSVIFPAACAGLQHGARLACLTAVRGSKCLACLSGIQISWRNFWRENDKTSFLSDRIPEVPVTQSTLLLLSHFQGGQPSLCSTIRIRPP